ncbi:MAG: DUF1572 domain-containing protein [Bacteroidia bacterium]|nr:DUF1572 domain-containing protein [Bacteroidia bacterium]
MIIIKSEYRRRMIEESLFRVEKCLAMLSEEEIWESVNNNSNSIGVLLLHLEGNIRQYVLSGIGTEKDTRERDKEFAPNKKPQKTFLYNTLKETVLFSERIIQKLEFNELDEEKKVQGFDETVLSIIVHVIEHCSYHVGQITYMTKMIRNAQTGYYDGKDLNVTS